MGEYLHILSSSFLFFLFLVVCSPFFENRIYIVMNRLSHRIDRQAAQTGKIEEFIALNPSILAEPFNRFTAAWSSIVILFHFTFLSFYYII